MKKVTLLHAETILELEAKINQVSQNHRISEVQLIDNPNAWVANVTLDYSLDAETKAALEIVTEAAEIGLEVIQENLSNMDETENRMYCPLSKCERTFKTEEIERIAAQIIAAPKMILNLEKAIDGLESPQSENIWPLKRFVNSHAVIQDDLEKMGETLDYTAEEILSAFNLLRTKAHRAKKRGSYIFW